MKNFETILGDIRGIHDVYKSDELDSQARPIELGNMRDAIKSYYGDALEEIQIKTFEKPPKGDGIWGTYRRNGKKVLIMHVPPSADGEDGPNYCHVRLIVAKELAHYVIDNEDSYTDKPGDLLVQLAKDSSIYAPKGTSLYQQKTAEEVAKLFGALILFPYEEIFEENKNLAGMGNNKQSFYSALAEKYKLPQSTIEAVLDDAIISFLQNPPADILLGL